MVRSGLPGSLLFACTHNSIRSPMAELLARRLYGRAAYIDSVGVHASELDGFAVAVLDELGLGVRSAEAERLVDVGGGVGGLDALVEATFPHLNGKVEINYVGTTIGSHTGPGTVALFFWGGKRVD